MFSLSCSMERSETANDSQLERFTLQSHQLNDTFNVDVWLPENYHDSGKSYPLLLLLDGESAFDPAKLIGSYLQLEKEIAEFAIVGLSYNVGFSDPLLDAKRSRDFVPPLDDQGIIKKVDTAYYTFIRDELLSELDRRYRVDTDQRTLWSYSLSGSFAAWLSYHDPSLFRHYIFASANLIQWGIFEKLAGGEIFNAGDSSKRRVFISYDQTEIPDPEILERGRALLTRPDAFPGYDVKFHLTENESHASSYFVSMPTALRHIYGLEK